MYMHGCAYMCICLPYICIHMANAPLKHGQSHSFKRRESCCTEETIAILSPLQLATCCLVEIGARLQCRSSRAYTVWHMRHPQGQHISGASDRLETPTRPAVHVRLWLVCPLKAPPPLFVPRSQGMTKMRKSWRLPMRILRTHLTWSMGVPVLPAGSAAGLGQGAAASRSWLRMLWPLPSFLPWHL